MQRLSIDSLPALPQPPRRGDLRAFLAKAATRSDLVIVVMMVIAIAVMILPLPTPLIDGLIALNIGASILVLMVGVYLDQPTKFSTLPAVILIATLFRLATEVAVTRVILVNADAGEIVRAFGDFVISGNVIVGLVTFLIITVVQFIVVTKGSERVAEVAARFSLDALPGKQMSIDGDVRGGDISKEEARQQRRKLAQESQLFGAMDGAMKFVKGDAITGLIIVIVNLLGGMAVGCLQHHMAFGQAVQTYSLLTVGDGLVAQIPALLISFAAGTIVTRVVSEQPKDLGSEVIEQISHEPKALAVGAGVMTLLALVPGFPAPIFLTFAAIIGGTAVLILRRRNELLAVNEEAGQASSSKSPAPAKPGTAVPEDGPIALVLSERLARTLPRKQLERILVDARRVVTERYGVELPPLALRSATTLRDGLFEVEIDEVPAVTALLPADDVILLLNPTGAEKAGVGLGSPQPAVGWADGVWVSRHLETTLTSAGLEPLEPLQAVAVCLDHALDHALGRFMGIQEARQLLTAAEKSYGDLVQEAQRIVPLQVMAEVFRRLVEERVPLRPMRLILGAVVEHGPKESSPAVLAEQVRSALKRQISHSLADADHMLSVLVVEREAEDLIRSSIRQTPSGQQIVLPETALDALLTGIREKRAEGVRPALLTSFDIRHLLHELLRLQDVDIPVLSYQDLSSEISVHPTGSINCGSRGSGSSQIHLVRQSTENLEEIE